MWNNIHMCHSPMQYQVPLADLTRRLDANLSLAKLPVSILSSVTACSFGHEETWLAKLVEQVSC